MFSSLATFLFGAQATSTDSTQNSDTNPVQANASNVAPIGNDQSRGDVIEVTSTTPSVAGNNHRATVKRSGAKNRRGRQRHQQQQQQQQLQHQQQQQQQGGQRKQTPTLSKLLTPNGQGAIDEDFNEDEWYIVEKEEEEEDSLPRSDSEEELSVVELQAKSVGGGAAAAAGAASAPARRRQHQQQHINSHSLYSGPRPQQQRNYLQRTRAARGTLSSSTRNVVAAAPAASENCDDDSQSAAVSQSLYAPMTISISRGATSSPSGSDSSSSSSSSGSSSDSSSGKGCGSAGVMMEESWYVTPPPCFTSIGPINMETSPFENLLIEHPSMSVYHSIRSSQAGTESFVNLDLGAAELQQPEPQLEPEQAPVPAPVQGQVQAQTVLRQPSSNSARFDRHAALQLKQQTLAREGQKSNNKKQHQQLCRSAIKRANKVRDFQAKAHRPRRSEMQHCKLVSGANNNRKCC
ncbi:alpha-protein kinase 1 isoform X1 [Drosophila grimshawi]|uniref:GH15680 n=1 Tax=Drosophila grimshawi TaxID=7222 RepID=B4IZN8_DROGR|nr:alpha-protein kinase 1 isoform X1 [Drosophila grimshawi]XP_032593681.1 alpha-protein kinase 1 isoform X1 [Drosophila grimshawi]XP_032593683.1 alpha-protein kinase 1 isoform X1 [Drosophila grimshawi]EDV95623.1 GH15680 [Drosophila grimshawi]